MGNFRITNFPCPYSAFYNIIFEVSHAKNYCSLKCLLLFEYIFDLLRLSLNNSRHKKLIIKCTKYLKIYQCSVVTFKKMVYGGFKYHI